MEDGEDIPSAVKKTKEMLRSVPNKGIGYGILKYLTPGKNKHGLSFDLQPEISFNYLGQFGETIDTEIFQLTTLSPGNPVKPGSKKIYSLDILGVIIAEQLNVIIVYEANEYDDKTMHNLMKILKTTLEQIIHHCVGRDRAELTASDLASTDVSEKEIGLIYDELEDAFSADS